MNNMISPVLLKVRATPELITTIYKIPNQKYFGLLFIKNMEDDIPNTYTKAH